MAPPPGAPRPGGNQGRTLIAIYEGQQYPVTKEEFIIGRGQKTSDLTIRDSNVSRRHAAVVQYNGQFWIVDQQSTNGVEFNGAKVERKLVEDGDLFRICDHEIQFVYRGPSGPPRLRESGRSLRRVVRRSETAGGRASGTRHAPCQPWRPTHPPRN